MGLPENALITELDYLLEEKKATEKHEYYNGQIFAMSGASIPHNRISRNLLVLLANKLRGKSCEPFGSDLRIHIPSNSLYTYPDISIFCGEVEKADTDFDTATNPKVIIEVLSKSKRDYDKGTKFTLYRGITTLEEYITIDSEGVQVECHTKNEDNSWTLREIKNLKDLLFMHSLELDVLLSDIYEEVF